jgi:hypothetical protein
MAHKFEVCKHVAHRFRYVCRIWGIEICAYAHVHFDRFQGYFLHILEYVTNVRDETQNGKQQCVYGMTLMPSQAGTFEFYYSTKSRGKWHHPSSQGNVCGYSAKNLASHASIFGVRNKVGANDIRPES